MSRPLENILCAVGDTPVIKIKKLAAELKGTGMAAKAVELARAHNWFLVRQFENEANADAHSRTTAEEILATMQGRSPAQPPITVLMPQPRANRQLNLKQKMQQHRRWMNQLWIL